MLIGFITGILSGCGVGGGTLLLIYLTSVAGMGQAPAQGINLIYFLPTAAAALILHSKNHYVVWKAVLPAALCGCATAALLSFVAMDMDLDLLKRLFGGFLLATGLWELFKKV